MARNTHEIKRYLLCTHISWVAGYDRYYSVEERDVALYENHPEKFYRKYAKEIHAYRTEKLIGAGALRDYDFNNLPGEVLESLKQFPPFEGYCFKNEVLYARIKINNAFFIIPPVHDEKQMDC